MANEKRLIDAMDTVTKISKAVTPLIHTGASSVQVYNEILQVIGEAPTVDAVEVVHGHWTETDVIIHKAGYGVRYYYHAECKVNPHRLFECENDYCPNCGAKMDGGNEDDFCSYGERREK